MPFQLNLRKNTTEQIYTAFKEGELKLSKSQLKLLSEDMQKHVRSGTYTPALNACIIGLLFVPAETMDTLKRRGLLRYSSYIGQKCIVENLASELYKFIQDKSLNLSEHSEYLENVTQLSFLNHEYSNLRLSIMEEFRRFRKNFKGFSLLKTLIAHVDFLFLTHYESPVETKGKMDELYSRSKEDISAATSYLIYLLSSQEELSPEGGKVADNYILEGEINKALIPAALIDDYKEIELLIEHYHYRLVKNGSKWILTPPTDTFERDMRLGFIRTDIQMINTGLAYILTVDPDDQQLSIEKIAEKLSGIKEFSKPEFVATDNYPRYRIQMTSTSYQYLYDKFFSSDQLLKDEAYHLAWIVKEQLLTIDSLKEVKISEHLRLIDFLKLKRYFLFMYALFHKQFQDKGSMPLSHLLHSLAPQLSEKHMRTTFVGFSDDMIDDFLDIICWEPANEQHFDMQYQPVIYADEQYLMPFNVIAQMNVIRNLYASEYRKQNVNLLNDGKIDPLSNALSASLTKAGISNITGLYYPGGEIDVIAYWGHTLFLIECKHSLHPGDLFELRRTYDYIKKAEKQLDRALVQYANHDLLSRIVDKFGYPLPQITKTVTLIVVSNRVLSGNNFKHPVRDFNDLDNFIREGTLTTNDGVFCIWQSASLQLADLVDHIENGHIALQHMQSVMESYTKTFPAGDTVLEYPSYFINMARATEQLEQFVKDLRLIKKHDRPSPSPLQDV